MRTLNPACLLLTLAGCLTAPGCITMPNVTWTPDSKGFYYTGGKGKCYNKLYYFDVATNKVRLVVDFQGMTHWPAVSPDGMRVAVAVPLWDQVRDNALPFQVVVYDATGKELQRSKPVSSRRTLKDKVKGPKDDLSVVWLFWAPKEQGDKVLLQAATTCGLVDLKADTFTDLGDTTVPWVFGNSPFRPDGKGFLTYRMANDREMPFTDHKFHEWGGKTQILSPDPWADADANDPGILHVPILFSSRWDKGTAVARGDRTELAVDTVKLTMAVKPVSSDGVWATRNQFRFGKDGAQVRVTAPRPGKLTEGPRAQWVDVLAPGAKERKDVFQAATVVMLQPSPDGRLLAIRCVANKGARTGELTNEAFQLERDQLLVINARGEVLADIDTFEE
jgi:hypothetical protein